MRTLQLNNGQTELVLRPAGYQFPQATNPNDANWLVLALRLRHADKQFEQDDPALQTFELRKMLKWITQIQDSYPAFAAWTVARLTSRFFFTEPNVSFEVLSASLPVFRVHLAAEMVPPFARELPSSAFAALGAPGAWIDFPMPKELLAEMAAVLGEWALEFPQR